MTREETRCRLGRLKITNLSENGVSDTTRNRRSPAAAVCIEPEETTGQTDDLNTNEHALAIYQAGDDYTLSPEMVGMSRMPLSQYQTQSSV